MRGATGAIRRRVMDASAPSKRLRHSRRTLRLWTANLCVTVTCRLGLHQQRRKITGYNKVTARQSRSVRLAAFRVTADTRTEHVAGWAHDGWASICRLVDGSFPTFACRKSIDYYAVTPKVCSLAALFGGTVNGLRMENKTLRHI